MLSFGLAVSVVACSDEDSDPPTPGGDASAKPSPTQETSAAAEASPPAKKGDKVKDEFSVTPGDLPSGGPEGKVARALVTYMELRVQSLYEVSVTPALRGIATGEALADVEARVSELTRDKLRTVGDTVVNVVEVTIDGEGADIDACFGNAAVDVNRKGVAAESPPPAYDVTATGLKVGKRWYIASMDSTPTTSC